MQSRTTAGWIHQAHEAGLDFSFLEEDKNIISVNLEKLGLPRPRVYFLTPKQVHSGEIDQLFSQMDFFCRLFHTDKTKKERPYRQHLRTAADFRKFCSEYDLSEYGIQILERQETTHAGNIIVKEERCIVEIIEGNNAIGLNQGYMTPIHAEIDPWTRIIHYKNADPSEKIRKLVFNALKYIGGPKNPLPGYYEFDVWVEKGITFRNYQLPDSNFINLEAKDLTQESTYRPPQR